MPSVSDPNGKLRDGAACSLETNHLGVEAGMTDPIEDLARTNGLRVKVNEHQMTSGFMHTGTKHTLFMTDGLFQAMNTIVIQFFIYMYDDISIMHGNSLLLT